MFGLSRSSSPPLPLFHSVASLSSSSSLSRLGDTESTQVPSSSLPSLRSANWRMSWCLTMVIIAVPPRTTSAVSRRGWQQQPWFHVTMNLHLVYDGRKIRFLHVENAHSCIISTLLIAFQKIRSSKYKRWRWKNIYFKFTMEKLLWLIFLWYNVINFVKNVRLIVLKFARFNLHIIYKQNHFLR